MGRPKKTETISENKKEKENKNTYFQVVKTLKNGTVMMIKGYDKEIK